MPFIRVIISLLGAFADKYGIDAAILIILSIGGWKLFTNHLTHLHDDVKSIKRKVLLVNKKVNTIKNKIINIDKRLTVSEKLCNERHSKSK